MSLGSFADLANVKAGSVERPKPIPVGHYLAQITGPMTEHKAKSGNIAMRFPCAITEPTDDVDAELLAAAGGIATKDGPRKFNMDFWMSPDARWRFTEFGTSMGHSDQLNLLELAEAIATSGDQFLIEVKHEPAQNDPNTIYARFDNPTAVAS